MSKALASQPHSRARTIGSSESPVIIGVDPRKTPLDLWAEKMGQVDPPDLSDNARVVCGQHIEEAMRGIFADLFGMTLRKTRRYVSDTQQDFLGASLDYEARTDDAGWVPAEGKTVDWLVWRDQWTTRDDGLIEGPLHVEVQLQHQLLVTDKPYGYFLVLVSGNEPHLIRREAHEPTQRMIRRECRVFWERYVNANVEPPADYNRDFETLQLLRSQGSEPPLDLRDGGDETAQRLDELMLAYAAGAQKSREGEAEKKAAKAEMLDLIGQHQKILLPHGSISAKEKPARSTESGWVWQDGKDYPARRDIRPTPKST